MISSIHLFIVCVLCICSVEHESSNKFIMFCYKMYIISIDVVHLALPENYYNINHQRWIEIDAHAHGVSHDETETILI